VQLIGGTENTNRDFATIKGKQFLHFGSFTYNSDVSRPTSVLVCAALFSAALFAAPPPQPVRPGNFNIYAEPTAKLQTGAEIPFQIRVTDDLRKPLVQAQVTLQIETDDGRYLQVFPAPATDRGVYVAKPSFAVPGPWRIYIKVDRADQETARTIEYNVPRSAE
jgi:hypothetical protein